MAAAADRNRSAQSKADGAAATRLRTFRGHDGEELLVAVMAYNLVRAIMFQAAQRAQIDPRQLSFTYARNIVLDSYPRFWSPVRPSSNSRNSIG